jgi:hypothetical protein
MPLTGAGAEGRIDGSVDPLAIGVGFAANADA